MLQHGGGAVVNNSSIAGLVGTGLPAYCASKHGVVGLTKSAALQYGSKGIRVNAVCPGFTQTPMLDMVVKHRGDPVAAAIAQQPLPRIASPDEVAQAVLWLCSDAASYVTGHAMAVDGGYVAR
jgi:NAD(P)-dependent dehydrogenase (short-subunit alcohol dehydrogenase family)